MVLTRSAERHDKPAHCRSSSHSREALRTISQGNKKIEDPTSKKPFIDQPPPALEPTRDADWSSDENPVRSLQASVPVLPGPPGSGCSCAAPVVRARPAKKGNEIVAKDRKNKAYTLSLRPHGRTARGFLDHLSPSPIRPSSPCGLTPPSPPSRTISSSTESWKVSF